MRKYHSHTLLYLHETIALGSGTTDRFTEVFVDTYQPMMEELGAPLHWPTYDSTCCCPAEHSTSAKTMAGS
jgi:hypothetical protein